MHFIASCAGETWLILQAKYFSLSRVRDMLILLSFMHLSIPAAPIRPRAFAYVLIPGLGHLQFQSLPEGRAYAYLGTTPEHLTF